MPSKTDPRWVKILTSDVDIEVNSISSKMLLMRLKLMVKNDKSPEKISEAVTAAFDFFQKNQDIANVKLDIEKIFK